MKKGGSLRAWVGVGVVVVVLVMSFGMVCEANFNSWRGHTFYQIVTDRFNSTKVDDKCYVNNARCGGTWKGIASRISYIKSLNVDGIAISPIELNSKAGWHGYFPTDWTKLDAKYGRSDDLENLISVCHSNNLKIVVDVNLNHAGVLNDNDLKKVRPFNDGEDYHPDCDVSAGETDLSKLASCRISYGDPSNQKYYYDLNQEQNTVRDDLVGSIEDTFGEFDFDGFRVPFGINIDLWFLTYLRSKVTPFMSLQVAYPAQLNQTNVNDVIKEYADYSNFSPIWNYPLYQALRLAFSPNSPGSMKMVSATLNAGFLFYEDPDLVINFIDNDDTTRFLYAVDENIGFFKNALALVLTSRGISSLYYGTEQSLMGDSDISRGQNRPILNTFGFPENGIPSFISTILGSKRTNNFGTESQTELFVDDNTLIYSRGVYVIVAITNSASSYSRTIRAPANRPAKYCSIFSQTCIYIDEQNMLSVPLSTGEPNIFVLNTDAVTPNPSSSGGISPPPLPTPTPTGGGDDSSSSFPPTTSSSSDDGSHVHDRGRIGVAVGLTFGFVIPVALCSLGLILCFYIRRRRYADLDAKPANENYNL